MHTLFFKKNTSVHFLVGLTLGFGFRVLNVLKKNTSEGLIECSATRFLNTVRNVHDEEFGVAHCICADTSRKIQTCIHWYKETKIA